MEAASWYNKSGNAAGYDYRYISGSDKGRGRGKCQVKDTKTDAQTYDATGDVLNKKYGETATAAEIIGKVTTTAPDDKSEKARR